MIVMQIGRLSNSKWFFDGAKPHVFSWQSVAGALPAKGETCYTPAIAEA